MLVAVLLVLVVGSSAAHARVPSVSGAEDYFDHFVFVELSPGADRVEDRKICENCSVSEYPTWTMHGLWPTIRCSSKPESCNKSYEFNPEEIETLRPRLDNLWPSLKDADCNSHQHLTHNEYFWCHEWEVHGTCALGVGKIQNEFDFFSTVLDLFENKLNYDKYVLAKQNILPSKTKYYWVEDFVKAFEAEWSVKPLLQCVWEEDSDRQVVESISTCLSKDFMQMRCPHCPLEEESNYCDSKEPIYYYPPNTTDIGF